MSIKKQIQKYAAPVGTTLDRFISQKQEQFPYATGELSQLLRDIALAGKIINREVNRAGLTSIESSVGEENVQGENQLMLDVVADTRFNRALSRGGQACCILSEEQEQLIDTGNHEAKYVVAIDPLDGSSNLDVDVSIGTIFSIFRRKTAVGEAPTNEDVLQKGDDQVGAGYILYGSSTMLVYSTGYGVHGFTYEPSLGEFILSHPSIRISDKGKIYSINEGSYYDFPEAVRKYVDQCKKKRYSARYIGSMVADFHRNMLKGGIFIYPSTGKYPDGKLRLMVECNPMAFLAEQAGGIALNEQGKRILSLQPNELHARSPLYIGSKDMVATAMKCFDIDISESLDK